MDYTRLSAQGITVRFTRTLLKNPGIKIKTDLSLHLLTLDAVIHHFYLFAEKSY
jgi:hypothetical protein